MHTTTWAETDALAPKDKSLAEIMLDNGRQLPAAAPAADAQAAAVVPTAADLVERRPWPRDSRYLIGDDGSILGPGSAGCAPKLLRLMVNPRSGRLIFTLSAVRKNFPVHVVVCETFHGPRPPGMEAAHTNGDKVDNRASNLSWKTRQENEADKVVHGTLRRGERVPTSKLTATEVREIRAAVARGESGRGTAARYGVAPRTVRLIVEGKTWRHLV